MAKITGIGGVVFKSKDPDVLANWYKKHLGIDRTQWEQQAGPTAFAPFPVDTEYFGGGSQSFMLNFRVDDLDAFLKKLKTEGIVVVKDAEEQDGLGLFAQIEDPEGNRIELWEPLEK